MSSNGFGKWIARRVAVWTAPVLLLATGCGDRAAEGETSSAPANDAAWNPQALTTVAGAPAPAVRSAIQTRIGAPAPKPLEGSQWARTKRLYQQYGQSPLWFGEDGLISARAGALMKAVIAAQDDALRVDRYPLNELARAVGVVKDTPQPTPEQVSEADVLLTATYVALGEDLLTGQVDPKSVSKDWHVDPQEEQVDSALNRTLRDTHLAASIAKMRPQDDDYVGLQRELKRYRQIASQGGFPRVPEGRALKAGESDTPARLAALRRRLRAEGLLSDSAAARQTGVYDPQLAGAVAEFQARHGIESDSLLGEGTVASLNTPAGFRLGQIAANLERYRWLPRSFGDRYILVNVPAFRVEFYEGGKKTLEMKTIVGQEYEDRITPVFSDSMEYVVFRPYWLVTPDIAEKELFPKIRSNPSILAAENYEVYQAEGATRIRQKPGPKNSLGLVKFMFPNDFNIYLHDTPNDELFKEDVRAFSHGCIRLEKPEALAQAVLGWDQAKVQQAMNAGPDDRRVNLPKKIPVYIGYFTTYMRAGRLFFGNDLYHRDDELIKAVAEGAVPRDAQLVAALESLRRYVAE
ncbi:MAG: L,D-transpeptidase family protein [Gemmatimonadetes bacterium]|nr:L,D-transpeptidase family protein [Gemmatimonadota bacterium]